MQMKNKKTKYLTAIFFEILFLFLFISGGKVQGQEAEKPMLPIIRKYTWMKNGQNLEQAGQELAEENHVFCNQTMALSLPTENVTFYRKIAGKDYIVRTYLFDTGKDFQILCFLHPTEEVPLVDSGYKINMISGYEKSENKESLFPYEEVYTYQDENLPTVRIRQFDKDFFAKDTTLDDITAYYAENKDLIKCDRSVRNGFDMVFLGYIENGELTARAYLDNKDEFICIGAEKDAKLFQHVVNALIDTIH